MTSPEYSLPIYAVADYFIHPSAVLAVTCLGLLYALSSTCEVAPETPSRKLKPFLEEHLFLFIYIAFFALAKFAFAHGIANTQNEFFCAIEKMVSLLVEFHLWANVGFLAKALIRFGFDQVGSRYRASQLTIEGCDENNNAAVTGTCPPFAVYDSKIKARVSEQFGSRKQAEEMRVAILSAEESGILRNTGHLPWDQDALRTFKQYIKAYHLTTSEHAVPPQGNSGISVKLKPVIDKGAVHYEVEILSGYRAGKVLCHGLSNDPVRWSSAEEACTWLRETGYTLAHT